MARSGMSRRVAFVRTDVSGKIIASIVKVKKLTDLVVNYY
jgi:hypothetical protein